MTSVNLKITTRGLTDFETAMKRILRKMHTLRVPMNAIGSYLVTRFFQGLSGLIFRAFLNFGPHTRPPYPAAKL